MTFDEQMELLQRAHDVMLAGFRAAQNTQINGGEITVDGDMFGGTCMSQAFTVERRLINEQGVGWFFEYTFVVRGSGNPTEVWRLYLDHSGHLRKQIGGTAFAPVDDQGLKARLIERLADGLVASTFFKPKPPFLPLDGEQP